MKLFDDTFNVLNKAMDLRFKRHEVLASNVANSETPNYRARELDFAGELERASNATTGPLLKTNPKHLDVGGSNGSHIIFDDTGAVGADGNNVDLDISTAKLSSNSSAYDSASNYLSIKFRMLRNAARGRGGA